MIKKWMEYIKESIDFEKLTHTEKDVLEYVKDLLDTEIDTIFIDVHQEFNTSSGDITPDQVMKLKFLKEDIAKLITEQVCSNIELKNLKSDKLNLEELSELSDERDEVKEGDEVIAIYTDNNITNVYRFKLENTKPYYSDITKLGTYGKGTWYDINDADLVVKVDTYNDFVRGDKRL
jgi:hypothetical protein